MSAARFSITPTELWAGLGSYRAPSLLDVRRREIYEANDGVIPASVWRDPARMDQWIDAIDPAMPIVLFCKAGHELSQMVAASLRARGLDASILSGGQAAWCEANLPLVSRAAMDRLLPNRPSVWVTRRRPKIDRIACPWLIRRFLDPQARILFVEPADVLAVARETGAIPFDVEGAELSHEGERCSFDTMLKVFGLECETSLAGLATIVRGADTARHDLASEAPGLHAISLGLSVLAGDDDHGLLERGFTLYDGLLAYLRFARDERHNWPAKAA
jgi:rhodanese-related sulfurtransferase